MKNKKKILPTHSLVENDEYFYRHPEMYRSCVDEDVFNLNEFVVEKIKQNNSINNLNK